MQINVAEKCFNKLWAKECYNDIYDNRFKSDNLSLLYNVIAVKTATGISKRIDITETIM